MQLDRLELLADLRGVVLGVERRTGAGPRRPMALRRPPSLLRNSASDSWMCALSFSMGTHRSTVAGVA